MRYRIHRYYEDEYEILDEAGKPYSHTLFTKADAESKVAQLNDDLAKSNYSDSEGAIYSYRQFLIENPEGEEHDASHMLEDKMKETFHYEGLQFLLAPRSERTHARDVFLEDGGKEIYVGKFGRGRFKDAKRSSLSIEEQLIDAAPPQIVPDDESEEFYSFDFKDVKDILVGDKTNNVYVTKRGGPYKYFIGRAGEGRFANMEIPKYDD
jgi:hypothetical protein